MKTFKINTYLPLFSGFYESALEYDNEDYDIEYYNEENGTNYEYKDFDFDYTDYFNRVAKILPTIVEELLNDNLQSSFSFTFQNLYRPRSYNYSNDSVNVELEFTSEDLKLLLNYLSDNITEFENYLNNNFTSCSGFCSYHSTDVEEWITILKTLESTDNRETNTKLISCFNFLFENEELYEAQLVTSDAFNNENWINFSTQQ